VDSMCISLEKFYVHSFFAIVLLASTCGDGRSPALTRSNRGESTRGGRGTICYLYF